MMMPKMIEKAATIIYLAIPSWVSTIAAVKMRTPHWMKLAMIRAS
jgi:hypothetical protein